MEAMQRPSITPGAGSELCGPIPSADSADSLLCRGGAGHVGHEHPSSGCPWEGTRVKAWV